MHIVATKTLILEDLLRYGTANPTLIEERIKTRTGIKVFGGDLSKCLQRMEKEGMVSREEVTRPRRDKKDGTRFVLYTLTHRGTRQAKENREAIAEIFGLTPDSVI